jgi:hypothetical protein
MKLTPDERGVIHAGIREALFQVQDGRPGAMKDVRAMLDLAIDENPELLTIARSFAEDGERRDAKRS